MKVRSIFLLMLAGGLFLSGSALAEERATRDEIVAMCKEASRMVMEDTSAAIEELGKKDGRFVWKDTYVFLMDINGKMLAHPIIPELTREENLLSITDKDKENPKKLVQEFIEVATKNGEGWVWYKWPKPDDQNPSKKFTYVSRVGFTDMFVAAGMYKE